MSNLLRATSVAVTRTVGSSDEPLAGCYSAGRAALLAVVCFVLIALRKPDALLNPQFFAEDGAVFFIQQLSMGSRAVFQPYNGYFLVLPRALAALASAAPIQFVPLVYGLLGLAVHAIALAWFFHPLHRFLLGPDLLRAIVSLIVAASLQGDEMLANLFNCQWHLLSTAIILLAAGRYHAGSLHPRAAAAMAAALLVIGLSCSMAIVALPVALWFVARPGGQRQGTAWALIIAMAIQLATFLFFQPPTDGGVTRLLGEVELLARAEPAKPAFNLLLPKSSRRATISEVVDQRWLLARRTRRLLPGSSAPSCHRYSGLKAVK